MPGGEAPHTVTRHLPAPAEDMLRRKLLCLYARGLSTAAAATRPRMPRISFPKRIAADGSRLSLHKGETTSVAPCEHTAQQCVCPTAL